MGEFFTGRHRGEPGLAVFLNAGDPPLPVLADLTLMLDERGVDCLELAVPFPGSVTDGPVVRRSAERALAQDVDLDTTLRFVAEIRPRLRRLRIALLADWSHSVKGRPLTSFLGDVAASGADGLLVHALPPRLRADYHAAAAQAGLPVVTTCYHGVSSPAVLAEAAAHASAYLYLVASYGRSGTAPAAGYGDLARTVTRLRGLTRAPIAVGFGVRTRTDVAAIYASGADAAIVGSAGVARLEHALAAGRDAVAEFQDFIRSIQIVPDTTIGSSARD
ncbi:tryptophan synthase subunit alpha [Thermostaphylospora chromogena]|uniref:tryptophan synthase n=1 Tax=Thermostaphylospora chromogena TaxID=35622 RepID=A0A1H1HAK0_9ACTN|nr:tryptophan synthase subunit alpha [Thermostaphylospora chromogena]SDR22474.1 tryptophan synthase, alpha chain [Thermostaphylospora chromogena]